MAFDPQALLSMEPIVTRQKFSQRDTMLYAVGVGARELEFIYEDGLTALPTMAAIMGYPGFFWRDTALGVDWRKVLHAEQSVVIHAPLPVSGDLRGETRIDAIWDKGADKGSIVRSVREIHDEADERHIATVAMSTFLRGNGGCGGSPGRPPDPRVLPDRPSDETILMPTAANQAEIYRLSGDFNPLHIDPAVARTAGFDRPILHGMCTYAVVGRALLASLCDNDAVRLRRLDARLSAPVYPGETISVEIWRNSANTAAFRAKVAERDVVVLNNGYTEFA